MSKEVEFGGRASNRPLHVAFMYFGYYIRNFYKQQFPRELVQLIFTLCYRLLPLRIFPLACGSVQSMVLSSSNELFVWGASQTTAYVSDTSRVPTKKLGFPQGTEIVSVACGENFSVAISRDAEVFTWGVQGCALYGQLGRGNLNAHGPDGSKPLDAERLFEPRRIQKFRAIAVACGPLFCLAIAPGYDVFGWGMNEYSQLGNGSWKISHVPTRVANDFQALAIACGGSHSLAVGLDGCAYAWGLNSVGQLGLGNKTKATTPQKVLKLANIVSVAAGMVHSLALDEAGCVYGWGGNRYGQIRPGDPEIFTPVLIDTFPRARSIACGGFRSALITKELNELKWFGDDCDRIPLVDKATNKPLKAKAIVLSPKHSMAISLTGELYTWGWNDCGQIGDGTLTYALGPKLISVPSKL